MVTRKQFCQQRDCVSSSWMIYRDYLDDKGEVRSDRMEKFEAFVWFVKNIFFLLIVL